MSDRSPVRRLEISVGGLSRRQLIDALSAQGIQLNGHAETLMRDVIFEEQASRQVAVTERTVAELGFPHGATLTQILDSAPQLGLMPCAADTAPFLRMALNEQAASRDSLMSSGSAPDGALTVAAVALSQDNEYPKGFYLRVVDGQAWLRGYQCDDEHIWSADDRFIFQLP